jgi:hypothetical protein
VYDTKLGGGESPSLIVTDYVKNVSRLVWSIADNLRSIAESFTLVLL